MSAADLKKEKAKLAMRARRAKIKAEKEADEAKAEAAGGARPAKDKGKRKVSRFLCTTSRMFADSLIIHRSDDGGSLR